MRLYRTLSRWAQLPREIPADTTLHLLLRLVSRHSRNGGKVLLPANASMVAAQIVERFDELNDNAERLFATPDEGLNR